MQLHHDQHVITFHEYMEVNPLGFFRYHLTELSKTDPKIAAFYDPVTDRIRAGLGPAVPLERVIPRDIVSLALQQRHTEGFRSGKGLVDDITDELRKSWLRATKFERNVLIGAKPAVVSGIYDVTFDASGRSEMFIHTGGRVSLNIDDLPEQATYDEGPKTTPDGRPIREHNYLNLRKGYKR